MAEEKSSQGFEDRELSLADVRQPGPELPRVYVISASLRSPLVGILDGAEAGPL
jgi:hypothetical protein